MAPRNRTLPALPDRTKQPQQSTLPVAGSEPPSDKGDRGATSTSDLIAEYCYHAMKADEFRLALAARDVDLDVGELMEQKGEKEVTMETVHALLEDRGRRVVRQNKTESKLTLKNGTSERPSSGATTGSNHPNTDNSIAAQLAARAAHQATLSSKRKRSPEQSPNPPPRHGPVVSVTNPRFLPGTNEPNPFFEQMPRPEVWHRQAPRAGFLGFGDTPFSQQMMSDQIDADLARGPGRRLGGGGNQDRKVESRSGRAGMWDVPGVSRGTVLDVMQRLREPEEEERESDDSEDEPMQSKKRKVEE